MAMRSLQIHFKASTEALRDQRPRKRSKRRQLSSSWTIINCPSSGVREEEILQLPRTYSAPHLEHRVSKRQIDLRQVMTALGQNVPIITGSCPDLSASERKIVDDLWTAAELLQDGEGNEEEEYDYELCSSIALEALHDAVTADKIQSPAVRALDRQIQAEMGMQQSIVFEETRSKEESEDLIFEQLVKDVGVDKSNPAQTPSNLRQELTDRHNFENLIRQRARSPGTVLLDPRWSLNDIDKVCEGEQEMHIIVNQLDEAMAQEPLTNGQLRLAPAMVPLDRPKKACCILM